MPIEANYQVYYGMQLDHYSHIWGGITYNRFLWTEFPNENLSSTPTAQILTADFIYPRTIGKTDLDGVAEGHFTIYNNSTTSASTVTSYTVTLLKTADVPNSMETLGSYSNVISTFNSVATHNYLTLPMYIPISKQILEYNEKLILRIAFSTTTSELCICQMNDSTDVDIQIKIPFAATG